MSSENKYDSDEEDSNLFYHRGNLIEMTNEMATRQYTSKAFHFLKYVLYHPTFHKYVLNSRVIDVDSPEFRRVLPLIENCSKELFLRLMMSIGGKVSFDLLFTIVAACLAIAVKLFGAHDWVYEKLLYDVIIYLAKDYRQGISKKMLAMIEGDIMNRTDWKACVEIAGIDKRMPLLYEPEEEEEDGLSNEEMQEMLERSSKFRKDLVIRAGYKHYSAKILYDGEWLLRIDGENKTTREVAEIGIKNATVLIPVSLLEQIVTTREVSDVDALEWLINRVIKRGFGIENVFFDVIEE